MEISTKYHIERQEAHKQAFNLVFDYTDHISKGTSFRYEIYYVPDGFFGVLNESNIWSGMVGEVLRKVTSVIQIANRF